MKLLRFSLFAALLTGLAVPNASMAYGEQIENFNSQVHITKQNQVEITETIDYNFGAEQHHGIYRVVPVDYHDTEGKVYHLAFRQGKVTDETGRDLQTSHASGSGQESIKNR